LGRENVETIQSAVSQVNSFVKMFLRAAEFKRNQEILFVGLATHEAPGVDLRNQNRQHVKRWPLFYSMII
jgi:hypothetical protein